jgi:hypothetical protein
MPKRRNSPYRGGEKFTVKIPSNADPKLLRLLNSATYLSPFVVKLLTSIAQNKYPDLKSANKDNINKVTFVKG